MSLTYLYNKLEKMNTREQYCYIQNILIQFQIVPKLDLKSIFEDVPGKESTGKNPLGYLYTHILYSYLVCLQILLLYSNFLPLVLFDI